MRRAARASLAVLLLGAAACKQEGTITVHRITFHGVHGVDEGRLRNALATRENTKLPIVGWELPWGRKNYFDRGRFDTDLQRIRAFYADRGYPDARVTGVEPKLNDSQDSISVTVTIAEGDPVLVTSVDFAGFDVLPPRRLSVLQRNAPLKVGKPRDRQIVVTTHEMALNELRDWGYPYAQVTTEENAGASAKEAAIVFKAQPGTLAHFGQVDIVGNKSVSDRIIAREIGYKHDDLYRRSQMLNTQRRLYGLELFQFVNIEPITADQNPEVPTRITVAEGKHQRVNFGVGYGSEEKARVDGEYHHVNFFGGARTAGVHARYSALDRGLRLSLNQPYLFRPHFSLGLEGQDWLTFTPAYESAVLGGKAVITHREGPRMSVSTSVTIEESSSTIAQDALDDPSLRDDLIALGLDPTTGKQEGVLTAIGGSLQRTTADNPLNATRGYQLAVHLEEAGVLLPGTFNYIAVLAEGRHYRRIGSRFVVANRLQLGNIDGILSSPINVPFSKKYFLGGANGPRGWGRFEVSPLSTSGLPLGGNSMFLFSSELRGDLRGNVGAVIFLDAGNVWENAWSIDLAELRYAVGPGLRIRTPFGPIRFDVGYQLNPIPGLIIDGAPQTRRFRLHFSIGQAF